MKVQHAALLAAQVMLPVATIPRLVPGLGEPTWHHNASLAVTLAVTLAALAATPPGHRRGHLALSVAVWTTLAVASAFVLLYAKQDLKATGYKDWAKFWHVAWSWLALWAFIGHTWLNRRGLGRAIRRLRHGAGRWWHDGSLAAILIAVPVTWSAWGAAVWRESSFIPWTLYTWLAFAGPTYAVWAWWAWQRRQASSRTDLPAWSRRGPVQGGTDVVLLWSTLLANLTGFPILYLGTKDTALKYVAKYWHTWPSIIMAIAVFAHTVQFWPGVRHHVRVANNAGAVRTK